MSTLLIDGCLGWTICSDQIYQQKRCQEDLSWTDDIVWSTTVSI